MTVYIKIIGHWTDSNPGFADEYVVEKLDVRDYKFEGGVAHKVKSARTAPHDGGPDAA